MYYLPLLPSAVVLGFNDLDPGLFPLMYDGTFRHGWATPAPLGLQTLIVSGNEREELSSDPSWPHFSPLFFRLAIILMGTGVSSPAIRYLIWPDLPLR